MVGYGSLNLKFLGAFGGLNLTVWEAMAEPNCLRCYGSLNLFLGAYEGLNLTVWKAMGV